MQRISVAIIDYGFGNVRSVVNALAAVNLSPQVVSEPDEISDFANVILPGVGAFATAMKVIEDKGLDDAIRASANAGANVLGICLGMQLLFGSSSEFGSHPGLGILEGTVVPLVDPAEVFPGLKSTHISWERVQPNDSGRLSSWFSDTSDEYYFVHSFVAQPLSQRVIAGTSNYRGIEFVAAVEHENVAGVQFHPERSGKGGLSLLSHFFRE